MSQCSVHSACRFIHSQNELCANFTGRVPNKLIREFHPAAMFEAYSFFCTCKNWKITSTISSGAEFYTSIQYSSKKRKVLFTISLDKLEKGNRLTTTSCLIPEIKSVTSKKICITM